MTVSSLLWPLTFTCDLHCPNQFIGSAGILFTSRAGQTDTHTHTHTHTQTNCSENITSPQFRGGVITITTPEKIRKNKNCSENADTSTSMTFDLDVWPWPYSKVKKAYVIRCRLLYCTLVPGMMSVSVIVCDICTLVHFLWPLTFACDLQLTSRSISL